MFYAHIVLAKKGPFARIWLAAHWDKKLTKAHVFETNIEQSVEGIMQPKVKLALRTSGHLLLGVVRIYSRKAKYLLADCNEAFVKIKMAFRPGMVDLPEEHREAAVNAITLPEVFHDFDTALPELNDVDIEAQFSINQSRADDITMREEYGSLPMSIHDDGFGDMGFDADEPDFIPDDPNIDHTLIDEELERDRIEDGSKEPMPGTSASILDSLDHDITENEGFGEGFDQPAGGLFEGDLFQDAPIEPSIVQQDEMIRREPDSDDDMDGGWDGDVPSTAPSSPAMAGSPLPPATMENVEQSLSITDLPPYMQEENQTNENNMNTINQSEQEPTPNDLENLEEQEPTTLHNEEESFALAPVDASALKGVTKAKRKRKLIVDEVKNISGEEMKSQLANTSDIITTLDLAPPTKRLMYWKETGGVEKVFQLCARDIKARALFTINQRHFVSRSVGVEDFSVLGPADVLALDQHQQDQEPATNKKGRKRKLAPVDNLDLSGSNIIRDIGPVELTDSIAEPIATSANETLSSTIVGQPSQHPLDTLDTTNIPAPLGDDDTPANQIPMLDASLQMHQMSHGNFSPLPLPEGVMTPAGLQHGDFPSDLKFPAGLDHGDIENLESIPNLPADQVSSILNGTGLENIGYSNMGYDEPASHVTPRTTSGMSERVQSDWNDDYDFPPSVGAHQPGDEQMENETDEQFEERVLNKRAAQMFVSVRARMQKVDSLNLSELTIRNNRKQAAQKFYSLLVLKKFQALEIKQESSYGDILITKGIMFDNPKL